MQFGFVAIILLYEERAVHWARLKIHANKIQPTITIMAATNNYVCYWLIYRSLLVNLLYNSSTANLLSKHFVQSLGEELPQ